MYFSKQTNGFYERDIHGENIPEDAVEITSEYRWELIAGQSGGKIITADENGFPILVDPPAPTPEQLANNIRSQRNTLLQQSDWTQIADAPVDTQAWATYRQALRDITEQSGFPDNVQWPDTPGSE